MAGTGVPKRGAPPPDPRRVLLVRALSVAFGVYLIVTLALGRSHLSGPWTWNVFVLVAFAASVGTSIYRSRRR